MLNKSEKHNPNYLAKVVEIKELRKHSNADRLQMTSINFQDVILGMNAQVGDLYVFFPIECEISDKLLSFTSSYRHGHLNKDVNTLGFFEDNGRVRAVKLRGERSMGYMIPLKEVADCYDSDIVDFPIETEFDMIGDEVIMKKYQIEVKNVAQARLGKKPIISRLVEGQVHLHVDTENLRNCVYEIKPDDQISITYKLHGTSFWVSNVLVKRKLNLMEKFAKLLKFKIQETEYDFVYGSRKVVKNEYETQDKQDFYGYDLWCDIKDELKDSIPKGYTIYGECVGYTKNGAMIQSGYDYGCDQGQKKIYVYRITITNEDGLVYNLTTNETKEFCERNNLNYVPLFFIGKGSEIVPNGTDDWHKDFIVKLEDQYTDKDCYICKNKVPEEGIVVRRDFAHQFTAYKLKGFRFLEFETSELDKGVVDLESSN